MIETASKVGIRAMGNQYINLRHSLSHVDFVMLYHMRFTLGLLTMSGLFAQTPPMTVSAPPRTLPAYISQRLSPSDRELFTKLEQVGLEAAWAAVIEEGYPQCFINELTPLNTDRRMVGRARTIRYLPNRKDPREKIYGAGPQLNYRSAEESQPGDGLVFDAGG